VLGFVVAEGEALKDARVLDYGCGVMPYRKAFELAGAKVIGADITKNKDALVQIGHVLPLADHSFGYVVSFQVLEHVSIPNDYLAEANRVLKSGGKLFLTTHGLWPYHPTPGDFHRWTKAGLVHELERAGFRVELVGHVLNEYSAAVQMFVMTADYRGAWDLSRNLVHLFTHIIILVLERCMRAEPEIPAIIYILGERL
jgi:SAM-dependent methyltransferase